MVKQIRDLGASVRARLRALAREKNQQFDLVLTRYVLERFLYRLSVSAYRERFVLKGAMLMTTWFDDPHRPTRDVDLLGYGDPAPEPILTMFREICAISAEDGVSFNAGALRIELIREELQYGGVRLRTTAVLAGARISVVVDIGFGDAVEPGVEEIDLPVLLEFPAPHLRAYARETVVAEKFQAVVMLGRANSRMKDLYDLWLLSKTYEFADDRLPQAIAGTFQRRKTAIPERLIDGLSPAFGGRSQASTMVRVYQRPLDRGSVFGNRDRGPRRISHAERAESS